MSEKNPFFIDNPSQALRRLCQRTGLTTHKLGEIGRLDSKTLDKWKHNAGDLDENTIIKVCAFLGISQHDLCDGNIDREAIRKVIFSRSSDEIPDWYQEDAHSSLATSAHLEHMMRLHRGQEFADSVIERLGVSPLVFSSLNRRINIGFLLDLLAELKTQGFSDASIVAVGGLLPGYLRRTEFAKRFSSDMSNVEVVEEFVRRATSLDENFDYSIKKCRKYLQMKAVPKEHVANAIRFSKKRRYIFTLLGEYRNKITSHMPLLVERSPIWSALTETSCSSHAQTHFIRAF